MLLYIACINRALNGSFALQHFNGSNVTKIRNGIMFDFYPGLPHIQHVCMYVNPLVCTHLQCQERIRTGN